MKKEEINKYLEKKVILSLKNNFTYKGKIINLNDDSLDFLDIYNNEMTISLDNISMIMIDKTKEIKLG